MSLGSYDEDEHERRENLIHPRRPDDDEDEHERREQKAQVDAEFAEERSEYRGELSYDSGESAEALLDQFRKMKGE